MSDEQVRAFLTPFTTQSVVTHLVAVLVGAGVFTGVYLFMLGDPSLAAASSPDALAARQTAIAVAGIATGVYFGLAWTRAIGGPGLNFLYPVGMIVVLPHVVALWQGQLPSNVWTDAEFIFSTQFTFDGLKVGLPGMLAFVVVMLAWAFLGLGSKEAVQEWLATHTSEAYQDEIVSQGR